MSQTISKPSAVSTPAPTDELHFHPSPDLSLGVELELQILDRETSDLAPGAVGILKACAEDSVEGVTSELMQSMIEVKTEVCHDVHDVREQLLPRMKRVQNIAASLGYELAMAGTHPFHRANASVVFPAERYEHIAERLAWLTYQRIVFGMHVHVGVPSGDLAMGVTTMMVQYLPHLLALSANSPFWQGVDTGLQSCRAALYRLLPHAGVPRYFGSWKEFRNYCQVMRDCKAIQSFKDIYWDIRSRPDLGTIEIRICDMPPTMTMVLGLVALIRSLVKHSLCLIEDRPQLRHGDKRRHWIAIENKWLATRYGLGGMYIRTPSGKRRQLRHDVADLIDRLMPIAREAGDAEFLAKLQPIDQFESGAARQRRLFREVGNWNAVVDDLKHRFVEDLEDLSRAPTK